MSTLPIDIEFWKYHSIISEKSDSGLVLTTPWSTHFNFKLSVGDSIGTRQYMRNGIPHGWRVAVNRKNFLVHRIIWSIHTESQIPENEVIDHIDGNPFNNSLSNLRCIDATLNARNACIRKDNKTGFPGITILDNKCGQLYLHAQYKLDKKPVSKLWPLAKYDYDVAMELAKSWLLENKKDLGFTERALNPLTNSINH